MRPVDLRLVDTEALAGELIRRGALPRCTCREHGRPLDALLAEALVHAADVAARVRMAALELDRHNLEAATRDALSRALAGAERDAASAWQALDRAAAGLCGKRGGHGAALCPVVGVSGDVCPGQCEIGRYSCGECPVSEMGGCGVSGT